MTRLQSPSDLEMVDAYIKYGSVHKAGKALGISHSRIHRRLQAIGATKPQNVLTDDDRRRIEDYYLSTPPASFDLGVLVKELDRTKPFICRVAREMGLTDPTRPMSEAQIQKIKGVPRWDVRPHPRGALGISHTDDVRLRISAASKRSWVNQKAQSSGNMTEESLQLKSDRMSVLMSSMPAENVYSRSKAGRRQDLGETFFRSSWEANYARYLNWLLEKGEIDRWEYEPETFWFLEIKRGVRSYKPDFKIFEKGISYFVEVKGWMDPKSKTKLKRMKKYYPSVRIDVVGVKEYNQIKNTLSRILIGWESAK